MVFAVEVICAVLQSHQFGPVMFACMLLAFVVVAQWMCVFSCVERSGKAC